MQRWVEAWGKNTLKGYRKQRDAIKLLKIRMRRKGKSGRSVGRFRAEKDCVTRRRGYRKKSSHAWYSWQANYQQKPNNRILLLPFINGSQAQKIRLLDFWPAKDTIYIPERNLGKTYNEQKGTINFRRCSEKDTIYISEPKQRKTYNKKIRFIFRSQNPQKLRLFDTVRLFGFCWYDVWYWDTEL